MVFGSGQRSHMIGGTKIEDLKSAILKEGEALSLSNIMNRIFYINKKEGRSGK